MILEANQFGKPAVGSRDCGIEDAIEEGVNGYLTEQRNPADIRAKVDKILSSRHITEESIHSFYTKFDWDKTVKKFIEEYRKKCIIKTC